ncbi:DUF6214 family protein [Streptomyces sp. DSM 44917]|uniref:DUF6214 family protein n=1 Tax=Streptomyces boetiae TaxID=3075541 RepID=A0ABU2LE97_9ACTN|nr:DUF6214 family protein [Streptomyces sp. DSM 44917]MDT0309919.1 DUF6214 family protein [Streptomyces sp. DSM 44917]
MVKGSFSGFPDGRPPDGPEPARPVWNLKAHGSGAPGLPPWLCVNLVLPDGARLDVLAHVRDGRLLIEDLRADPPLALDGLAQLPERLRGPLREAGRAAGATPPALPPADAPHGATGPPALPPGGPAAEDPAPEPPVAERSAAARRPPAGPEPPPAGQEGTAGSGNARGRPARHRARRRRTGRRDGLRAAARVYLAARDQGADPVLAVMRATGRSRRRALRLIAAARDKGHLTTPRHARR